MLYVLYGEDGVSSREKLENLLSFFKKKHGTVDVTVLDGETATLETVEEALRSGTLFAKRHVVVGKGLLENVAILGALERLARLAALSENLVILREKEIVPELLAILAREAKQKPQRFDHGVEKKSATLPRDPFAVTAELARRDGLAAWARFTEATLAGEDPVEIFWRVWWQVKTLLIVATLGEKTAIEEAGLHPFVALKAARALKHYSRDELESLAGALTRVYHDDHRGEADLGLSLEKILLGL